MLDAKDSKIVNELKQDSRSAIRDIAKKTGIRPSTVHQRITKLKREGVIESFTVKLNNEAVGESFIVMMLVSTTEDLPQSFFNDSHVKECFGITGEYDLLLKLKFGDINDFNDYVIKLRKNKPITKTITMVSTITLKEEI